MPVRLIREGILTSDRVEQLDPPAEVFYRRLMNKVDDHGLFDARPNVLRSSLYPLRVDRVREADCSRWIAACEKAGLIALYQHDEKPYLQMLDTRWAARSAAKFPLPSHPNSVPLQMGANGCFQLKTDAPVFGVVVVVEDDSSATAVAQSRFEEFWAQYPRKVGKDAARKAFDKRKPSAELLATMLKAIDAQRHSDGWTKDGGQFIPHPSTWLNEGRWQDEIGLRLVVKPGADEASKTSEYLREQTMTPEQKESSLIAMRLALSGIKTKDSA